MIDTLFSWKAEYEVLAMESRDCAEVAELHAERFPRPWTDGEFVSLLSQSTTFGFVARPTNNLVFKPALSGFVLARQVAGEAEILTVAVQEKAGRAGLGWRLMQAALRQAALDGGQTMFLEVEEGNSPAIGLYRKLGFEVAGRRPAYYTDAEGRRTAALVMRRDLR
ncbi:GNAT family N-acetyltransferase [Rhizobium paknamense]|uniref:Ribosomal-protein-alanine N-acetyltransferase n=1 Tax=Rhizobium paknamense TaxID=1206817 RepID=A0ABU0ICF6_9HYPH|nr:N-acetyltransferase [Rhizobium paknamense]MDQ0455288.1 ribosomal-protein-alanine N-acetyltransferase [Rhizobium paknamense]